MSEAVATSLANDSRHRGRDAFRRVVRAFWVALVPAAMVVLALRYLVPAGGTGLRGIVAALGNQHTLPLAVALYFAFSGVARYWHLYLVGAPEKKDAETGRLGGTLGFVGLLAGAVVIALVVRTSVARPYRVLTASMLPTLGPNDLVGGRMRSSGGSKLPGRGEVVVFQSSAVALPASVAPDADVLVKRVIGLPGDRVAMRGGAPMINDWIVPSCDAGEYLYPMPGLGDRGLHGRLHVEFLDDGAYLAVYAMGPAFPETYVVKPGEVFVLGDNRGNSLDSRSYHAGHGGGVPLQAIEAQAAWFLLGPRWNGDTDFSRLLKPVDALQTRLHLESVATDDLEAGIARCLKAKPMETHPPRP